jgi:hypothetical protein
MILRKLLITLSEPGTPLAWLLAYGNAEFSREHVNVSKAVLSASH